MNTDNINLLITPSSKTIKATFTEIMVSSGTIKKDIESLIVTLEAVDDILDIFVNSSNLGTQFRSINPITWSIPATAKLIVDVISKYVTKKTGFSFADWVSFINSALKKFSDYTKQLDKIPEIASKYGDVIVKNSKENHAEFEQDEICLLEIKSETENWKGYIEKATKLSIVLDAILDAQKETEIKAAKDGEDVSGDLKKIWGAITDKADTVTDNKTSEIQNQLIKWFFSSVYDLKSKTKNFNQQTRELLPKLSNLENLLDLEIAQIQAYSGKIKKEELGVLGTRVAAAITVPQLRENIIRYNTSIMNCKDYLEKLRSEISNKNITKQVYDALSGEYETELSNSTNILNQTLSQARIWKKEGAALIEHGIKWANNELEIIKARRLVGQITLENLKKESKRLNEEIRRLEEAQKILASI